MVSIFTCNFLFFLMLFHFHVKGIYCGCNISLEVGSCIRWSDIKKNYSVANQHCRETHGNLITVYKDICNSDIVKQLLSRLEGEPAWTAYDGSSADAHWCPRYDGQRNRREKVPCSTKHHYFCYHNQSVCSNSTDNNQTIIIQPQPPLVPDYSKNTTPNYTDAYGASINDSVIEKGNYTTIAIIAVYLACVIVLIITGVAVVKIKECRQSNVTDDCDEDYVYHNYAPVRTRSRAPLLHGGDHPIQYRPLSQEIVQNVQGHPPLPTLGVRPGRNLAIQSGSDVTAERVEMSTFFNDRSPEDATPLSMTAGFNPLMTQGRNTPSKHGRRKPITHGPTQTPGLNAPSTSGLYMPRMQGRKRSGQDRPTTQGYNAPITPRPGRYPPNTPASQETSTPFTQGLNTSGPNSPTTPTTSGLYTPLLNPGEDASSLFFGASDLRSGEGLQEIVENPVYESFCVTTEL